MAGDITFSTQSKLPPFVEGMVAYNSIEHMEPGESTYSAPGVIHVDAASTVLVDKTYTARNRAPAPPVVNLKLVQGWDGMYVDVTALSRADIEGRFAPLDSTAHRGVYGTEPRDFIEATGVIYPFIADTHGQNPTEVAAFNAEQTVVRRQFARYYQAEFGRPYVFADQEIRALAPPSGIILPVTYRA